MAAKPHRTLFEAMRTAKGRDGRAGATPAKTFAKPLASPKPVVPNQPKAGAAAFGGGQGWSWAKVPPKTALIVAGAVVLVFVAWVVIGKLVDSGDSSTIGQTQSGAPNPQVADNAGKTPLRGSSGQLRYQEGVSTGTPGTVRPVDPPVTPPAVLTTGDFAVRICRSTLQHQKDQQAIGDYLARHGIETITIESGGFLYLYSKQGFSRENDPEGLKLCDRIRGLSKAFSDESRSRTDFRDAYIHKKPVN
jgi:hypothetical protein